VQLNDRVVGVTEVGKTQRNTGLLCVVLKMMRYSLYKQFLW